MAFSYKHLEVYSCISFPRQLKVCCSGTGLILTLRLSTALNKILFLQQTLLKHKINVPDICIFGRVLTQRYTAKYSSNDVVHKTDIPSKMYQYRMTDFAKYTNAATFIQLLITHQLHTR